MLSNSLGHNSQYSKCFYAYKILKLIYSLCSSFGVIALSDVEKLLPITSHRNQKLDTKN